MISDPGNTLPRTVTIEISNTVFDVFRGQKHWKKLRVFAISLGMFLKVRKQIYTYGVTPLEKLRNPTYSMKHNSKNLPDYFLFYPDSFYMKIWYIGIFIFLIYTAIFMPIHFCFQTVNDPSWLIINTIIDLFFILDVFVNFNTSYYEITGKLITNRKKISVNYLKTWFTVDLISSFPIQLLEDSGVTSSNHYLRLIRFNRVYRLFSLFKLLRFMKTSYHTKKFLSLKIYSEVSIKFLNFFLATCVLIHILGCIWIMISTLDLRYTVNWYVRMNMQEKDMAVVYLYAIYYVFTTLTTIGYGDIVPITIPEKIFAVMLMGFGIGFYSLLIGNLNTLFTSLDERKRILTSKLNYCQEFAKATSLSDILYFKIKDHIELNADKLYYDVAHLELLKDIPFSLREKLSIHLYKTFVKNIYFFQNRSYAFLNAVVPKLKRFCYNFNDVIYSKDEESEEIFFINKGRANFKAENNLVFRTYTQGSYFGEIEVIENRPRESTVISASIEFEVLTLIKSDCLTIFDCFPEIFSEIKNTANIRKEIHTQSKLKVQSLRKNDIENDSLVSDFSDSSEGSSIFNRSNDKIKCELLRKDTGIMISVQHDTFQKRKNRALWSCAVEGHPKGKIYKKAKTMKADLDFNRDHAATPQPTQTFRYSRGNNREMHNSCFTLVTTKVKTKQAVDILYRIIIKYHFKDFKYRKEGKKLSDCGVKKTPRTKVKADWVYDNDYLKKILSSGYNERQDLIKNSRIFFDNTINIEYNIENTKDVIYSLTSSQLYLQDALRSLETKINKC
ncbi:hypothetical protein SteCoe_7925 [Stentor coeruleus]|uniref:Cyclic nucleotide-binding domain-containing protein n=1 Tax=Stentor coeruleus TaxID=5963 RepID=A0A1R2CLE3_9CILI|nr:hypothetical protein SteCoe_7925 [Stentor coeruleus]